MKKSKASGKRNFGLVAAVAAIALAVAGIFVGGGAAYADTPFEFTPQPYITGDYNVGDQLTGDLGYWDPTPDSLSYQWYSDGSPIGGASGTTTTNDDTVYYMLTGADEGNTITLSVTAARAGYTTTTETSDPTITIGAPAVTTDQPTITGSTTLGSTLTADPGSWGPGTVTFAYQWQRDNHDISGATSSTYVTVPRDSGQQISVFITGSEDGYQNGYAFSDPVGPISGVGLTISGTVTGYPVGGGPTVGPLEGIFVFAYQGTDPSYIGYGYTDSDGNYSINFGAGASPDGYTVKFNEQNNNSSDVESNYVYEFLGGAQDQDAATTFSLSAGNPSQIENEQLALGATITGTAKDPNGNPLSDSFISAHPLNQYNGPSDETDNSGNYTLTQVSTADTIVQAYLESPPSQSQQDVVYYNPQWWDHVATAAAATPVSIIPGQTTSGIDFDATLESTVTGRVVDQNGDGVPYMNFVPWHLDAATGKYVSPQEGPFYTDANGYFTLAGNWPGYKLQFFDQFSVNDDGQNNVDGNIITRTVPFATTWYGGTGTIASATPVVFSGTSDHEDIGNVVVAPQTGGPSWTGAPEIDLSDDGADTLEIDGGVPSPGNATVAVQWYRDDVAIDGETNFDHHLASDDTGHVLTAKLTASLPGFDDATVTTTPYDLRQDFVVTAPPTLSGTPQVDNTLSVVDGTYSPTPDTTAYQWFRQAGSAAPTAIPDATASSYQLTGADAGDTISVSVTLSKAGYHSHTFSVATTGTVTPGVLSSATPTITGTPVNGSTLTANEGSWGPGTVGFTYQWFDGSTAIGGATGQTYVLQTSDIDSQVSVSVTGTETGYSSQTLTSAQTSVVLGTSMTPVTPIITDAVHPTAPTFGDTLSASVGGWAPSDATFSYQWLNNGATITGATEATYPIAVADVGAKISVTVTATKDGYATTSQTSAETATVAAATFSETTKPSISGPSSLNKYTVSAGAWSPVPATTTYQWSANDVPIDGATASTYTPTSDYAGETLAVAVTVTQPGYTNGSDTANSANTVEGRFSAEPAPTIQGTVQVGSTLSAATGTWVPTPDDFTYHWYTVAGTSTCTGTQIREQDDDASGFVLVGGDAGNRVCVSATANRANFLSDFTTSAVSAVVAAGTIESDTPTITGTLTYGNSLTAHPGTWSPSGETFTYQWQSNGAPISGAVSSTYALQTGDIGKDLSVVVTGTLLGYADRSATSDPTTEIQPKAFVLSPAPTITPSAVSTGQKLTASTGTWSPAPGSAGFTYQWYRGDTAISEATLSTYTITGDDIGQPISVQVTGTVTGYAPTTKQSAGVVPTAAWTAIPKPTITGTAKVGATITAHAGTWSPSADDITYSYAWTYGSTTSPVGDASSSDTSAFVVPAAADGKTITVTVTAHAAGYPDTHSAASSKTAVVTSGTLTTVTPTFTGTLAVGNLLTVDHGDWSPDTATFKYQWYRGSTAISGATKSTYTTTSSDKGKTIKVKVTGSATGYSSASVTSAVSTTILAGTITDVQPAIVGAATYGTKLTINKGTWGPGTVAFKYQWYRDGAAISGATSSTYTITTASVGHTIAVRVTGSKSGYTTVPLTSDSTATITDASFASAPVPTISGTLSVGSTLTAKHATESPSTSVTISYQWYRQLSGGDPQAISKATKSTYKLAAADAGDTFSVQVTYKKTGYFTAPETSSSTTDVWTTKGTPTISGIAKVGNTLTASPGTWLPTPDPETGFTYQWYRSGTAITLNGDQPTYSLVDADRAKTITVKVTASVDGFGSLTSAASKATATVSESVTGTTPAIVGAATYGTKLSIDKGAWGPGTLAYKYQWYRDTTAISGATSSTYTITSTSLGHKLSVKITGSKSGYTSLALTSDPTDTITALAFTSAPVPTISGTPTVGSTLTAKHATETPSTSVTVSYQWYRDGEAIAKATSSTYKLVAADAGRTITVKVTYKRTGYVTTTPDASLATDAVAT